MRYHTMKSILPVVLTRNQVTTIPMLSLASNHRNLTRSPVYQPRNNSSTDNSARKVMVKPQPINRNQKRRRNIINDNYCVVSVAGKKNSVCVTGKSDTVNGTSVNVAGKKDCICDR